MNSSWQIRDPDEALTLCRRMFTGYGLTPEQSRAITKTAGLCDYFELVHLHYFLLTMETRTGVSPAMGYQFCLQLWPDAREGRSWMQRP